MTLLCSITINPLGEKSSATKQEDNMPEKQRGQEAVDEHFDQGS